MKLTVSQLLAKFLREAGVEYIFGVSGHPLFSITDAIYQEPGIDMVPTQMELPGAYAANAYAATGRRLSACIGSAGPGVTNLLTGVAEAQKESVPLMALGADVDDDVSGKGASSWHELPQAEVMAPVAKLSRTLRDPKRVLEALQEAHAQAVGGRKGPVYLGFPPDVQAAEIDLPDQPWIKPAPPLRAADAAAVDRAAQILASANRPVIIAGGGVHWSEAEAEVLQLAEVLAAPVANPHSHKGLLPETHPNVAGVVGYGAYPFAEAFVKEADVILAVGLTFNEGMTYGYGHRLIPKGVGIVQIDIDPVEIGKSYPAEVGLAGDAKLTLQALIAALRGRTQAHADERKSRLQRLGDQKEAWFAEISRRGTLASGPITHWHVEHAVRQALPADAMVVAAGCTGEIMSHFVAPTAVYQSGDFRAIGHGLASAIGIKHALPDRLGAVITGDGSFMMEMNELATAARTGYPDLLVIIDNAAYGGMKRDQIRHHGGRIIGTELCLPDLPAMAKSFGLYGRRVSDPAELPSAVQEALAHPGPALLDCVVPVEGI